PPAAMATPNTTRRAAFIRFTLTVTGQPRPNTWRPTQPRAGISTAKGQGMVKERYLNRVNIVFRAIAVRLGVDSRGQGTQPVGVRIDRERRRGQSDAVRHAGAFFVQAEDPFLPRECCRQWHQPKL